MLPPLNDRHAHVFLCQVAQPIDQHLTDHYLAALSQDERVKYHSFHFTKDRQLYLYSHAMLRLVLAEYMNCSPQSIELISNQYGKPRLKTGSEISFNLSHAKQAAALIIHVDRQLDLGIDIEANQMRGALMDLAEHSFSQDEVSLLKRYTPAQQDDVFFKLWTLKEAYIKAIGKGLSIDLKSFSFDSLESEVRVQHCAAEQQNCGWYFAHAKPFEGYQMALAVRSQTLTFVPPEIKAFRYQPGMSCAATSLKYVTSSQFLTAAQANMPFRKN